MSSRSLSAGNGCAVISRTRCLTRVDRFRRGGGSPASVDVEELARVEGRFLRNGDHWSFEGNKALEATDADRSPRKRRSANGSEVRDGCG